jgi:hypothetical protein
LIIREFERIRCDVAVDLVEAADLDPIEALRSE